MARRKTPRVARRSRPSKRRGARPSRARSAAGPRKKSTARKARPARARKSARVRGASPKQARARKATASRVQRKTSAKTRAKKSSLRLASKAAKKTSAGAARQRTGARTAPPPFVARKAPSLDRERRVVRDDDIVPTPPSSLDLDRSASAARSGRRELHERFKEHTETSPAITGGDIDADWESAYTVGDEAPGGDNPTPDQDIVDDIGKAVGVQYEDNEELKGETKIAERDRKRWELDPASSEDYNDR